jgi:hypothetical protein
MYKDINVYVFFTVSTELAPRDVTQYLHALTACVALF